MKKNAKLIGILVCALLITSSMIITADWTPGDGHKMHYPQLPDEAGWDVYATAGLSDYGYQDICLADDWNCSESGPVKDIHFWGSWKGGIEGNILSFSIAIHDDIPADQSPTGYSMPGTTLWEETFTSWTAVPIDPPAMEGWYNPSSGEIIYNDHDNYFQYNIVDIISPFYQLQGTIYWLSISAIVEYDPTGVQPLWGWKSSLDHWNDDACWAEWGVLDWIDLWEPSPPVTNGYWIAMDPMGNIDPLFTGGTDYYDDGTSVNGWYYYMDSEWWNIWFYDHPFDYDRIKEIFTSFSIYKYDPGQPSFVEVAINWATDLWPPDSPPPIPPDEEPYIAREIFLTGQDLEGYYEYFTTILDYNPEWVSIDVRGYNFIIETGIIEHACLGSLDLAFVITGDNQSGPEIEYSKTVWNESSQVWDDYIEAEVFTNARFNLSIHNEDTDSVIVTKIWDTLPPCVQYADNATFNGIPLEPDVINLPNIEWNYPIPADYWYPGSAPGELPPGEWIFIEFGVFIIGPPCTDNINWGYWNIFYDGYFYFFEDNATVHPISDEPWPNHKMHFPQLPDPFGWDVLANFEMPFLPLADDWQCSETGPITDIHFWGSWLWDIEGPIDGFDISIWDDIPANQSPTGYSTPGTILWNEYFSSYDIIPMNPSPQGWYDPYDGSYEPQGNHMNYWQYNIENISNPFIQQNGTIYWLCIRPSTMSMYPDPPLWGWKTSLDHFNDDAVYWLDPIGWMELYEPITGLSLDLSFVITGEEEPCETSIDVEKYVWDPLNEDWVDADDPSVAVDLTIGSTAQFKIAIHNDGQCCNLTNIYIYDFMEDSLTFIGANVDPLSIDPVVGGTEIIWSFPGPLPYCNWINITVWAEVVGEVCTTDYNYVNVSAYCDVTGDIVYDEDYAYVHAIESLGREFGDAPEGPGAVAYPSTGVFGGFPTCITVGPSGWIQHNNFGAWFGPSFDFELDGNGGFCPGCFPLYDQDECFADGDAGLIIPDPYTIDPAWNVVPCPGGVGTALGLVGNPAVWGVDIDIDVTNFMPSSTVGYVNVLMDWNQNGVWGDAGEHVLVNFPVPNGYSGPLSGLAPPGFVIGPNPGYVWSRFSITEVPVIYPPEWNGEGDFEDGETEDYLLKISQIFTLTITTTGGTGSGSVNAVPGGPYYYGDVVNLTAVADVGSHFVQWSGDLTGSTNPDTITMNANRNVEAQFDLDTYTLTLNNNGSGSGTIEVNNSGPYYHGDLVKIWANASADSVFTGFYGDLSGTTSPQTLTMDSNKAVTAEFTLTSFPPIADFDYTPTNPTTTETVYFNSTSTDPDGTIVNWTWNIGGIIKYGEDITHQFTSEGTYVVTLTVTDNEVNTANTSKLVPVGDIEEITTNLTNGWNLVSPPFNQSVSKSDLIIKYNNYYYSWSQATSSSNPTGTPIINQYIFGWNRVGQSYNFANSLDPGYGYWFYSYQNNCEIWAINIITTPDNYITGLKTGWNLIGIPDDTLVNKTDLIIEYGLTQYNWSTAVSNGYVSQYVFGWNRISQSYNFANTIDPGYGYWMYAFFDCILKK